MKPFTSCDLSLRQIPESIPPFKLILVKALSTLAKFCLPLLLESIYEDMKPNHPQNYDPLIITRFEFIAQILIKIIISVGISYLLQLTMEETLIYYRLQVKKQLTTRILENNINKQLTKQNRSVSYIKNEEYMQQKYKHKETSYQNNIYDEQDDQMNLWSKISSKMPIYVYNYYNSLLALVFQTLNFIGVSIYLFSKLSYSLFFGLFLALAIMKKVLLVTHEMQENNFENIKLQQKKHSILQQYFNSLIEYKMTWLDQFIYKKVQENELKYQQNLQKNKLLDCWCVMLWRFTSVSISSVILVAFYFIGVDSHQTMNPATLINFLMILTMPLNGLSWNIAGLKNSLRAIQELKKDVAVLYNRQKQNMGINNQQNIKESNIEKTNSQNNLIKKICNNANEYKQNTISSAKGHLTQFPQISRDQIFFESDSLILIQKSKHKEKIKDKNQYKAKDILFEEVVQSELPQSNIQFWIKDHFYINKGEIIQAEGQKQLQLFLQRLPFLLKKMVMETDKLSENYEIGYVEQNGWQMDNIIQSILINETSILNNQNEKKIINTQRNEINKINKTNEINEIEQQVLNNNKQFVFLLQLLQIFQCHQIPEFSKISSKQLSGGQKMRINLVRAFYNTFNSTRIIIMNTDLSCLDQVIGQKVVKGIRYLAHNYNYRIICKKLKNIQLGDMMRTFPYLRFQQHKQNNQPQKNNKIIKVFYHKSEQIYTSDEVDYEFIYKKPYKQVSKRIRYKLLVALQAYRDKKFQQKDEQLITFSQLFNCTSNNQQYLHSYKQSPDFITKKQGKQLNLTTKEGDGKNKEGNNKKVNNNKTYNNIDKSQTISLKTFSIYYQSKLHIMFLIGIMMTTACENYYNYYLNNYITINNIYYKQREQYKLIQGHLDNGRGISEQNIYFLIFITFLFLFCLWVRSYFFAIANIKQAKRISRHLNKNVIMNQITFYQTNQISQKHKSNYQNHQNNQSMLNIQGIENNQSILNNQSNQYNQRDTTFNSYSYSQNQNILLQQKQQTFNKQQQRETIKGLKQIGQSTHNRLIYLTTKDSSTVSDWYPWHANILFNNLFTLISSVLIISNQIPSILLLFVPLLIYTIHINKQYQNSHEKYIKLQKRVEQRLMESINQIEQGRKYLYLFKKLQKFKSNYYQLLDQQLNLEWKLYSLKKQLNLKYKTMMLAFLIFIIVAYGFTLEIIQPNIFRSYLYSHFIIPSTQRNNHESGTFPILIHYTMLLTNYMLYFTFSLAETLSQANSIERIRSTLSQQNTQTSNQRVQDFSQVLSKIKQNTNQNQSNLQTKKNINQNQKNSSTQSILLEIKAFNFCYNKKSLNRKNEVFKGLDLLIKRRDKIEIKGKSGHGKTTLYKILCSLYKQELSTVSLSYHISFSPQHPLLLPQTRTIIDNVDPYNVYGDINSKQKLQQIQKQLQSSFNSTSVTNSKIKEFLLNSLSKLTEELSYEEKILINNLRAWLYGGKKGLKIYDEPYWINQSQQQTYIITTHCRSFKYDTQMHLINGKLIKTQLK